MMNWKNQELKELKPELKMNVIREFCEVCSKKRVEINGNDKVVIKNISVIRDYLN